MTREAVSAAKPAVRAQAKTEKVHGAASAAVLKGLVYGAAMLTFAVLLFLLGYILVTGIPHLKPSLFQWNYTSENVSMMPAILTTVETTALALLLAVPLGLFTAVYLNEYAKRGNTESQFFYHLQNIVSSWGWTLPVTATSANGNI